MRNLKKSIQFVIRFRIIIMIVLALLMALAGHQTLNKLSIDNSLTIWFLEDDPSYKAYIDFQEDYGSDEIYIAMFPVDNAIDKNAVDRLKKLTLEVEELPYVKTTFSLAKAKYPIYTNNTIRFDDLYNSKRSEKGLKSLFSKLHNVTSQLVSEDYKNLFFYVQLNPTPTIERQRKEILGELTNIIDVHFITIVFIVWS